MAEEEHQEDDNEKKEKKTEKFTKKLKSAQSQAFVSDYWGELLYLIAMIIAGIYSLVNSPKLGVGFVGIGFLIGLILYSVMNTCVNAIGGFLKKQEMITLIIVAIVIIVLAFIIPPIIFGIMLGIPAGLGVRKAFMDQKEVH